MRNLILFVWKYHFTFIFILLELLALALLSTNNNYQRTRMHNASLAFSGSVFELTEGISSYMNLNYENDVLRQQNALLENELYERVVKDSHRISSGDFDLQPARVISSTYGQTNNYAIVNLGRKHGIETDMGVSSPEGVLGTVTHVSDNYSAVMLLINGQTTLSCKLEKNNYFGLLQWKGTDHGIGVLEDIPNHVQVDSGDAIVTRGANGVYPSGLKVGHIVSNEQNATTGVQVIYVAFATNFEKLNTAYIIRNAEKPELDSLMQTLPEDE